MNITKSCITQTISKNLIKFIEQEPLKYRETFSVGDFIELKYRITEGNKEKIQTYSGLVIAIQNRGPSRTFTLKRTLDEIGIEQIIPMNSPKIISIKRKDSVKVRRAKLYFLRLKHTKKLKGKYF